MTNQTMTSARRLAAWTENSECAMYLTGVSTDESKSARRVELGVLAQPGNSVHADVDKGHYAIFGADNGFYGLGTKSDPTPEKIAKATDKWWAWLGDEIAERRGRCLFATVPDHLDWHVRWSEKKQDWERYPVGDAIKTLRLFHRLSERPRSLRIPVALVAQDGLRSDGDFLVAGRESVRWDDLDCLFVGGSDAFKLGADAEALCREALRRGIWTHVGRVNSWKRIELVRSFANSVDGTLLQFGPTKNWPRVESWLDRLTPTKQPRGGSNMPATKSTSAKKAPPRQTAAQKAARSSVKRVVEPGKAASKRKSEAAAAKVKANADKVADLNAKRAEVERDTEAAKAKQVEPRFKGGAQTGEKAIDASTPKGWSNRHEAGKREAKAVDDWKRGGEKGPMPPTPNLDAANADHEAGKKPPSSTRATAAPRTVSERSEAARDAKRKLNGKRGPGKKITDDELADYIRKIVAKTPDADAAEERRYAYWVEKLGITDKRWFDAWEKVVGKPQKRAS